MITKQEESVGYLFAIEQKHRNHAAMGPKGDGSEGGKKVERLKPDSTGKVPVPKKVAEAGAKLAIETQRAGRDWDGAKDETSKAQRSKVEWRKRGEELTKNEEKTRQVYSNKNREMNKFEDEHGVHPIQAWEASEGKHWPYYKVDTGSHEATHYVKD